MISSGPLAAVEAGGTKFICALSDTDGRILSQTTFPTRGPSETFAEMTSFFARAIEKYGVPAAGGLASFGPVQLDPALSDYGLIEATPKPGWTGANILGAVKDAIGAPVAIDTDVNAAALGEGLHGAATDVDDFAYVTIGTGIGVGVVTRREVRSIFPHAEMGHMRVPRFRNDTFRGTCPYHLDCLEGLACGPAIAARWGRPAPQLPFDHPAWQFASHYAAALCVNLTYCLRLQRIILGGGVMTPDFMLDRVRTDFAAMMADYALGPFATNPATYLVAPALTDPSPSIVGALDMARRVARRLD